MRTFVNQNNVPVQIYEYIKHKLQHECMKEIKDIYVGSSTETREITVYRIIHNA